MAKKKSQPKRLFKKQEVLSPYQTDRSPSKRMMDMMREHEDVLQNIEFVFVTSWREDPAIDDAAVDRVLSLAMGGVEPDEVEEEADPRVTTMFQRLGSIRQLREDIPDPIWLDGLRVVRDSVRRHSERRPGQRDYLEFVEEYIK